MHQLTMTDLHNSCSLFEVSVLAIPNTRKISLTQRVLNATARVITGTRKFDRGLRQILHDVPDGVLFDLAVTVHQCLNGRAPPYLSEHCIPVSSADMRRHLCSVNRHLGLLAVPRFRLNTYGRRAFSVVVPMISNSRGYFFPGESSRLSWRKSRFHGFRHVGVEQYITQHSLITRQHYRTASDHISRPSCSPAFIQ